MTYAGDVTPAEAFAAVTQGQGAALVDVRTRAEWAQVGVPQLDSEHQPILVEWQRSPDGSINDTFVDELRQAGLADGAPIYFLCRSGVRSVAAAEAATAAGLGPAYNVLDGFEGPHDRAGQRTVAGWKVAGLPWKQG
ncbi:rhodanese-like domain-containing protein [Knoellia sp. Soil729]|uniref:rhodanese-like domain-containing protein n=1 Tax=Knoellia sp. Soil729 TaxID=1736394 RepID=UPI0006F3E789|nr:rhodanese-like domain-containing protein [Knoellia sp. Soil729]KRE43324.1 sulfurtransferase [Knoellia sp. Soil729]